MLPSVTSIIRFSLGFNHDPRLIQGLKVLNDIYGARAQVDEVFGALPDAPLPSARPSSRLPRITWTEFAEQVQRLRDADIAYNYLFNTASTPKFGVVPELRDYLFRLRDAGVTRLTVGTPALCRLVREMMPGFHLTISITHGIDSVVKLMDAEEAGPDALYLQPVTVNRNFALLRQLVFTARCECRLYANVSCISGCPVVDQHYRLFASQLHTNVARVNDLFYAGCSMVKISDPVEWIQMPWIRPEDVPVYAKEGIRHFKLSDRLASTDVLLMIAEHYLKGKSPEDMFPLIERDGTKFQQLATRETGSEHPFYIRSCSIPSDFIEHFRRGYCTSRDVECPVCQKVAQETVIKNGNWLFSECGLRAVASAPHPLKQRAAVN